MRVLLCLTLLAACRPDLSITDPSVMISCEKNTDCPPDWICQGTLARCIPLKETETPAPLAGDVTIAPRVANAGATIVVELTASSPLFVVPSVRLGDRPFNLVEQAEDHYRFVYTTVGNEREGPATVLATLTGRNGEQTVDAILGTVVLDFTPPLINDLRAIGTTALRAGSKGTLAFTVNETVSAPPRVTLTAATTEIAVTEHTDTDGFRFEFTVAADMPEGDVAVTVHVTDAAGNGADKRIDGVFTVDRTPPALFGAVELGQTELRAGAGIAVTARLTELGPNTMTAVLRSTTNGDEHAVDVFRFGLIATVSHTVDPLWPSGTYELLLDGVADSAGNVAGRLLLGTLTIDNDPPSLRAPVVFENLNANVGAAIASRVAGFDTLRMRAVVGEQAPSAQLVVGGTSVACTEAPHALGFEYTCDYTTRPGDTGGSQPVSLVLGDSAGNVLRFDSVCVFDFLPPSFSNVRAEAATVFAPGDNGFLLFSVSEPLAADPIGTLTTSAPLARDMAVAAPDYRYQLTTDVFQAAGAFGFTLDAVDRVGNASTFSAASMFTLDDTPPALASPPVVNPLLVRTGDLLTVAAVLDASGADAIEVVLKRGAVEAPLSAVRSGPNVSVASLVPSLASGAYDVVLRNAFDEVGNMAGPMTLGTIEIDNDAPLFLTGLTVLNANNAVGSSQVSAQTGFDTLSIAFSLATDEPNSAVSIALGDGDPGFACNHAPSGSGPGYDYFCSYTLTAGDLSEPSTPHGLVITVTDAAGNSASKTGSANYDFTPPSISGTPVFRRSDGSLRAVVGNEIHLSSLVGGTGLMTFRTSEPLSGLPLVSVGTATMSADGNDTYTIAHGSTLTSVAKLVRVTLTDRVGNAVPDVLLGTLLFDEAPPLVSCTQPIALHRKPWGAGLAADDVDTLELPCTLEPDATLVVYSTDNAATATALAHVDADTNGALPINPVPLPGHLNHVYYAVYDRAGNQMNGQGVAFPPEQFGDIVMKTGRGSIDPRREDNPTTYSIASAAPRGLVPDPLYCRGPCPQSGVDTPMANVLGEIDGSRGEWARTSFLGPTYDHWREHALTVAPPPRALHAMGYDPFLQQLVVFGGYDGNETLGDTWVNDGSGWREHLGPGPKERAEGAMSYYKGPTLDPAHYLIYFGGYDPTTTLYERDTWAFGPTGWTKLCDAPGCPSPSPRRGAAMAYLDDTKQVAMFGGRCSEPSDHICDASDGVLWSWGVHGSPPATWQVIPVPAPLNAGLTHAAIAYDQQRRRLVVFGGSRDDATLSDEVWEWDPELDVWEQRCGTGCSGGSCCSGTALLGGRAYHGMAYHAAKQRTYMLGGCGVYPMSGNGEALFYWDGDDWSVENFPPPELSNPRRESAKLVYDSGFSRLVSFAGGQNDALAQCTGWEPSFGAELTTADQWSLADAPSAKPAVFFTFDWAGADVAFPSPPTCFPGESSHGPKKLVFRAVIGGEADDGSGGTIIGARLLAWSQSTRSWVEVGNTDAPLFAEAETTFTLTDDCANLHDLWVDQRYFHLRVEPKGPAGTAGALVSVDFASLQIFYAL